MTSMTLKTYAKINLSLDVLGRRDDGYHEVAMVMHAINLYDEMMIRTAEAEEDSILLKTDKYYVPTDERNTAYKAAQMMIEEHVNRGGKPAAVKIDMKKNIPVAAGLAGGSSNAAGVLAALNILFDLKMSLEELCKIGERIGADVPFCLMPIAARNADLNLNGGAVCALAEGIGEKLTALPPVRAWVVMAKPPMAVSTVAVYKAYDSIECTFHPDTGVLLQGVKSNNFSLIKNGMANVLEEVTLKEYPVVGELKTRMRESAEDTTMMSGSGPTIFSLFTSRKKAEMAFERIKPLTKERYNAFIVKTLS